MGLCKAPDIFQEKMSKLMMVLEVARAHSDDPLVISKGSFEEPLQHLEVALTRLSEAGLKVNVSKSSFHKPESEHVGLWTTRKGI